MSGSKMSRTARLIGAAIGALLLAAPGTGAIAADTSAALTEAESKAADELVVALYAAIARLPANASAEDVEAAIVFTVSQARASCPVIAAALPRIQSKDSDVLRARDNALRSCSIGTGSIGSAGRGGSFGSSGIFLSTPVIGVGGGGGSNYTPSN